MEGVSKEVTEQTGRKYKAVKMLNVKQTQKKNLKAAILFALVNKSEPYVITS